VILWSPVIIVTRMPPAWHSFTASMASLRGGIEQADQAEQHEVLRQIGGPKASGLDARIGQPRQSQHALALACEDVGRSFEKRRDRAASRRLRPAAGRRRRGSPQARL